MKLGLIVEGTDQGADELVFREIVRHVQTWSGDSIEAVIVPLGQKPALIADCGKTAAQLFEDGCERVGVVWDMFPNFRAPGDDREPSCVEDRREIEAELQARGLERADVFLVCIREELEAWLIADDRAILALKRPTHKMKVQSFSDPDYVPNPKKVLRRILDQVPEDFNRPVTAAKIARALPDLNKIRNCQSFRRFVEKVTGRQI